MHLEATRSRRIRHWSVLALVLGLTIGCSPPDTPIGPDAVEPPAQAPKVQLPSAVLPDGFAVDLELAITPREVANGLMYRPSLPEDRGMLFVFEEERFPSFWMKNTFISLDIVFLDSSAAVVHVAANVPPCAVEPCPTYSPPEPALAVLELAAGTAAAHGVDVGTVITFDRVSNFPVAEVHQDESEG